MVNAGQRAQVEAQLRVHTCCKQQPVAMHSQCSHAQPAQLPPLPLP